MLAALTKQEESLAKPATTEGLSHPFIISMNRLFNENTKDYSFTTENRSN